MFGRHQSEPAYIEVGSVLNDRYRLVEQLGQGGAGVIYKAEDQQLERVVAIKLFTAGGGMAADALQRFWGEARSVARLNHPNIITLYDFAETQGLPYLVMEYIPGEDLWALDNSYSPDLMPFVALGLQVTSHSPTQHYTLLQQRLRLAHRINNLGVTAV